MSKNDLMAAVGNRNAGRAARSEEARGMLKDLNDTIGLSSRVPTYSLEPNPYNSRTIYSPAQVEARAKSMKHAGQAQAILVAEMPDGRRITVDGWTRKLASELLAEDPTLPPEKRELFLTIDAVVRTDLTMQDIALLSYVANEEHNSLTDMDRAMGFAKALTDKLFATQEELAEAYGISQSTVTKLNSMATAPAPLREILMANPEKLTYSFFAEVADLGVPVQGKLLSEAASLDRSVAWLRNQVASCKRQAGEAPVTQIERLEDASLKWSTASRARSIEISLRSKKDQLDTVTLLTRLFHLSSEDRALFAEALKDPEKLLAALKPA